MYIIRTMDERCVRLLYFNSVHLYTFFLEYIYRKQNVSYISFAFQNSVDSIYSL